MVPRGRTLSLASLIQRIAMRLPFRTIEHYSSPYLTRFIVLRTRMFRIYLHRFHRPDADHEHHSHPWPAAIAMILTGGYVEERLEGNRAPYRVIARHRRPGSVVLLRRSTYHRASELADSPVWTLFIPFGKNSDQWNFRHPVTGETTPWRPFIRRQGRRIA